MQTSARSPRAPTRGRPRALRWLPLPSMQRRRREVLLGWLACVLVAGVVAAPVVVERAIEDVRFRDTLGTFPVEVGLCHDGRSTLDTGILGKVFWDQTGTLGFGAYARATGPPEAGGTLASYVDPAFFQTNVAFIRDPDEVVAAYSSAMRSALRAQVVRNESAAALLGGTFLYLLLPRRRFGGIPRSHVALASFLLADVALGLTALGALKMFDAWGCSKPPTRVYSATGLANPTFSSPQMSEIVSQVRPFIRKNTQRIDAAAERYEATAKASLAAAIRQRGAALAPRAGETVVLAEADPQGSFVGVHVRTTLYAELAAALGKDAISLRTIAGDVTSNGTVAEVSYVKDEARVSPGVPVVAVGGDHDSVKTWKQMTAAGITVPDLTTTEVGGLRVAGGNDREHKTLFGGIVTNPTGLTEGQLGQEVRTAVGDGPAVVLMHQPDAVSGYLGLGTLSTLRDRPAGTSDLTTPSDDGIPDLPPGIVDYGHTHSAEGPWIVWNTGGKTVTWTVVDQLGTAGGVENSPTFSRFSTPFSAPLKTLMVRLQYVNPKSGLETGYATVACNLDGSCTVSDRVDVGLPGGLPDTVAQVPGATPSAGPSATTSR